jgi:hypothetical protein
VSGCFACGGGDRWIKTCRLASGERVRVCDPCHEALRINMTIVPGTLCVTAKCRSCGAYGNPRNFTGLEKGEPMLGLCAGCA